MKIIENNSSKYQRNSKLTEILHNRCDISQFSRILAIASDEPAWSELALRIFGDYGAKSTKEIKLEQQESPANPKDLDQQLIQQAKSLNMTPKRFQLLWASNQS